MQYEEGRSMDVLNTSINRKFLKEDLFKIFVYLQKDFKVNRDEMEECRGRDLFRGIK